MDVIEFTDKPDPWCDKIRASLWLSWRHPNFREIGDAIETNLDAADYSSEVMRDGGSIRVSFLSDEAVTRFKALNIC
jgi:hypothetical protein